MLPDFDMMEGRFLRLSDCPKIYKHVGNFGRNKNTPTPEGFKEDMFSGMLKHELQKKYSLGQKVVSRIYNDVLEKHIDETGESVEEFLREMKEKFTEYKSKINRERYQKCKT